MRIDYWNDCDTLDMLYQNGWRQTFYLNTVLAEPSHSVLVEDSFYKWKKIYRFDAFVPEYMVDALMTLPMHDNVEIDGNLVDSIDVAITWHSRWALVSVSFSSGYYIRRGCNNLSLAINTSAPPGECFSPDITIKGVVSSYGTSDGTWLLATASGDGFYDGLLYTRSGGENVILDVEEGQGVYDSSTGYNYFYNGVVFHRYPWISTISQTGTSEYRLTGFAFPDTFVYVYYRPVSGGAWIEVSPIYAATFESDGITIETGAADDYEWYIDAKTFSCDYGSSDTETYWTGYILLNDFGEYIVQNASNDRLYR